MKTRLPKWLERSLKQCNGGQFSSLLEVIEQVTNGDLHLIKKIDELQVDCEVERKVIKMVESILNRDRILEEQAASLMNLVEQRTRELEEQKIINIQNSKLSALGEMAGGIAHEINTPLATIKLYMGLCRNEMESGIFDPSVVVDYLNKVETTVDKISKIVRGLRSFSRDASRDPFVKFCVNSVVEETLVLCREKIKNNGIDLKVDFPVGEVLSIGSEVQIGQVILNLLSNSVDAVSDLAEKWIEIKVTKGDGSVAIEVMDSGEGIAKEVLHKIFDPFFTTKGVEKGTGLGLSISHGIVRSHKGKIFVREGIKNTCFVVVLPEYAPGQSKSAG